MGSMKKIWANEENLDLIDGSCVVLENGDIAEVSEVGLLLKDEFGVLIDYIKVKYLTNKNNELRLVEHKRKWQYLVPLEEVLEFVDARTADALYKEIK